MRSPAALSRPAWILDIFLHMRRLVAMLLRSYVIACARVCVMLCPWFRASRRPLIYSLPCTSTLLWWCFFFFFKKFISMVKNKNPLNCVCISLIVIHRATLLLVTFAFSVNHTDVSCHYKGCFPTTRILPLHDSSNLPCNYNTNDLCS